jgi:hypothetical protein
VGSVSAIVARGMSRAATGLAAGTVHGLTVIPHHEIV